MGSPSAALLGILFAAMPGAPAGEGEAERLITDFSSATPDLEWYVVNDNVMGGRSEGGFELQRNRLSFTGSTNTQGGGFSSIRTGPLDLDLSRFTGIRVRVRGDGRRYTWRLTTDARFSGQEVGYWAEFETVADEWRTYDLPMAAFRPRFRGSLLDGPPLDTSRIEGMGLMIYDGEDGRFELLLDRVAAYVPAAR